MQYTPQELKDKLLTGLDSENNVRNGFYFLESSEKIFIVAQLVKTWRSVTVTNKNVLTFIKMLYFLCLNSLLYMLK